MAGTTGAEPAVVRRERSGYGPNRKPFRGHVTTGSAIMAEVQVCFRTSAVSQRGHIVKPTRPRKTWAIMYRDGDANMRWEGKFNSRTDAQRRLTSVLAEIDKGTYTRPSSLKFEQFSKEWLAGRRQIRGSTESGYGFTDQITAHPAPRLLDG